MAKRKPSGWRWRTGFDPTRTWPADLLEALGKLVRERPPDTLQRPRQNGLTAGQKRPSVADGRGLLMKAVVASALALLPSVPAVAQTTRVGQWSGAVRLAPCI